MTGLLSPKVVEAAKQVPLKTAFAKESTSICPYCGVGCGLLVSAKDGKIVNVEGDSDHPVNEGSLCSKGQAVFQVGVNERRLKKVQYRPAGSDRWEEKSWDWAVGEIAKLIKKTRDATFVEKDAKGQRVNRAEGLAVMGGAALDNEECYLLSKFARSTGVVYLEHQARI
jgi:formate dehydrogenase major subunit